MSLYKFGGREHPFSNFYDAKCTFEGIEFSTVEGAFQAAKTLDVKDRMYFKDCDPSLAKKNGRKLSLRGDWEQVKYDIMVECLISKFSDLDLRSKLLNTGDSVLVEDTTGWHDNEWGNCECPRCISREGKNLLGKALMDVRRFYKDMQDEVDCAIKECED